MHAAAAAVVIAFLATTLIPAANACAVAPLKMTLRGTDIVVAASPFDVTTSATGATSVRYAVIGTQQGIVRVIDLDTGAVLRTAGSSASRNASLLPVDGPAADAIFVAITSVAVTANNSVVLVADGAAIRRWNMNDGTVSTVAAGGGTNGPLRLATTPARPNVVYVADAGMNCVYTLDTSLSKPTSTVVAGQCGAAASAALATSISGAPTAVRIGPPTAVAVSADGATLLLNNGGFGQVLAVASSQVRVIASFDGQTVTALAAGNVAGSALVGFAQDTCHLRTVTPAQTANFVATQFVAGSFQSNDGAAPSGCGAGPIALGMTPAANAGKADTVVMLFGGTGGSNVTVLAWMLYQCQPVEDSTNPIASNLALLLVVMAVILLTIIIAGVVIAQKIRGHRQFKQNPTAHLPVTRGGALPRPDAIVGGEMMYRQPDGSLGSAPPRSTATAVPRSSADANHVDERQLSTIPDETV